MEHNATKWQITLDGFNQVGKNAIIWGNTLGDFYESLPENIKIRNKIDIEPITDPKDPNYDASKVSDFNERLDKLFRSKANEVILGIVRNKPIILQDHVSFSWLTEETKQHLRHAVYQAIQESLNGTWYENRTGGGFNTQQLSISDNLSGWVISAQQLNTASWNELQASKIDNYKIVSEDYLSTKTPNGNVRIIGRINAEAAKYIKELK